VNAKKLNGTPLRLLTGVFLLFSNDGPASAAQRLDGKSEAT